MQTITTQTALRKALQSARQKNLSIAFVPTMGNLHRGHLRLVEKAKQLADVVVVSIFVNPLQFSPSEDFSKYPRTLAADSAQLSSLKTDILFAPEPSEIYPEGIASVTEISVPMLSDRLCGKSRPEHFTGVATVVTKLFNLVQPNVACFGEKDFQQLRVVQQLTRDLCLPITIVGIPTERDTDGLALSSRNQYLSVEERKQAPKLYQTLRHIAEAIKTGSRDYQQLSNQGLEILVHAGFKPDYLEICRPADLATAAPNDNDIVILTAAYLGTTRLIDNLPVTLGNPL